jgi:hypothetical protein
MLRAQPNVDNATPSGMMKFIGPSVLSANVCNIAHNTLRRESRGRSGTCPPLLLYVKAGVHE